MTTRVFLDLCDGWALGFDPLQWMLMRARIRRGQRELQPVAFVATEKRILRRVLLEKGVQPTSHAEAVINAMPDTFQAWKRKLGLINDANASTLGQITQQGRKAAQKKQGRSGVGRRFSERP